MQLSKEQLQQVLDNAPAGADKTAIIGGLYERGVTIQGVDSYEAQKFLSQNRSAKIQEQVQQADEKAMFEKPETSNLGTGFDPSFESLPSDTAVKSVMKTAGNLPKSSYMLGKDIFTAVTNPIDTLKSVGSLIKGVGGKVGEKALEETDIGQALLGKMNEYRVKNGIEPLKTNEEGKIQAQTTEEIEMVNQVGSYFEDRYGSLENFKESAVEDPAGVLSDIASVVSGAGFAVKQTGNVSRLSRLSDVGQTIQRAGDMIEPATAVTRGVGAVTSAAGNTLPGRIVSEAAPTPGRFAEGEIVKALDLTQGDLQRIAAKTDNDVADFVTRNNLLKETPEEIAMALDDFKTNQYTLVRDEVARVPDVYTVSDVPRVKDALNTVQQVVDGIPGLEESAGEINRLLNQEQYSLSDVQRVKEILDANTNIFSRSGDVRGTATAEGLANVRSELRSFIEDEVSRVTNGQTDIKKINNDVATSRELVDAIELRETRDLTRKYGGLTSVILGGAAFGGTGDIFTALGVAVTAKMLQTPSFRIALAKGLNATPAQDLKRWSDEIATGNLSPQTRQALTSIIEESRKNAEFIESGSQVIAESQPTEESTQPTEQ